MAEKIKSKGGSSRCLNSTVTYAQVEVLIKEYANSPKNRLQTLRKLLKRSICVQPKLNEVKTEREKDALVNKLEDLSCRSLSHSELLRRPAIQCGHEELANLDPETLESFYNPIIAFMSILHHHEVTHSAYWLMEKTKISSPRLLVNCQVKFPNNSKLLKYRIDIARLCYPIWQYQHIFYGRKNHQIKQSMGHTTPESSSRIGTGAPMCFQEIRVKNGYEGALENVSVDVVFPDTVCSLKYLYDYFQVDSYSKRVA